MKTILHIIMALAAAMAIAACGMNEQEPGSSTYGVADGDGLSAMVGIKECLSCHMDEFNPSSLAPVVGDSGSGMGWMNGPHANGNGRPSLSSTCATICHNQLEEGAGLTAIEAELGVDLGGEDRPVITCESCHGSGADHFGTGAVEYTRPDAARCGQCHNEDFPHESHPAGDELIEKYTDSRHVTSVDTAGHHVPPSPGWSCAPCHSDEGVKGKPMGDGYTPVQCRTCHNPHNPHEYLMAGTDDGFGNIASSQYNTCTQCHQTSAAQHGESSTHSWEDYQGNTRAAIVPALINGAFEHGNIIYDTHWDNPDTEWVEGYVIDPANERACSGCHDVHEAKVEELDAFGNYVSADSINEQWARSAHGGHIAELKPEAFELAATSALTNTEIYENTMTILNGTIYNSASGTILNSTGDVTEDDGPAWVHYDFKSKDNYPPNTNQYPCRRCHTSTGFVILTSDPATYRDAIPGNAASNGYYATGEQREMLYCWACHESTADHLRGDTFSHGHYTGNELVFSELAPYTEPAARILNVPDIAGSNVCMACHSGRQSGVTVTTVSDFMNSSAKSSHYLAAGGVLFGLVGYENSPAPGAYDSPVGFVHDNIGGGEGSTWGDNGPCVACHMKSHEGHSLEAALYNSSGLYDIPTYEETCSLCHGATASAQTDLEDIMAIQNTGFHAALDELKAALEDNGIYHASRYPYFYNAPYNPDYKEDGVSCSENLAVKNWQTWGSNEYTTGKNYKGDDVCNYDYPPIYNGIEGTGEANMGAAFNYTLLSHEPGAYAHNSLYTRRLIFDSIDAIDNGSMDGTISVAEPAMTYLGGGLRP